MVEVSCLLMIIVLNNYITVLLAQNVLLDVKVKVKVKGETSCYKVIDYRSKSYLHIQHGVQKWVNKTEIWA